MAQPWGHLDLTAFDGLYRQWMKSHFIAFFYGFSCPWFIIDLIEEMKTHVGSHPGDHVSASEEAIVLVTSNLRPMRPHMVVGIILGLHDAHNLTPHSHQSTLFPASLQ